MEKAPRLPAPASMIISAFSFALMSAAVKYGVEIPFMQKVFFRNFVMAMMIFPILAANSRKSGVKVIIGSRGNRRRLFTRSVFGFFGVVLYFFSVERLYLGDSAMLNKLSAFFVIILSAIFLREKIRRYQIPALAAAFTGSVLIIKPGFNMLLLPALAGLGASMLAACAYTLIASLRGRENPLTIIFWFSAISTAAALIPMLLVWKIPGPAQTAALVLTGIFAASGQFFLTKAYTTGPAGEISIYNYTHVVFSVIIGFFLWGEIPDLLSFAGAALIIGAAAGLYIKGRRETAGAEL